LGVAGVIRVDENGYFNLNDIAQYFPLKRLDVWMKTGQTNDFIMAVEKVFLIPLNGGIIRKRGRNGGTYAHELIALEFATWLSPEFKVRVYNDYLHGNQTKKDWNLKRIMAAENYKLMTQAIEKAHEPAKFYHYSNEAIMLNKIVFGKSENGIRETASETDLDSIAWLEFHNAAYIDADMDFESRKTLLQKLYQLKLQPKLRST